MPRRAVLNRLREAVQQHPDTVTLHLGALTPDQVTAMAQHALSAPPGPELASLLHQAAGNPLYLREVLDTLIRDGSVHTTHGVADLAAPVGELSLGAAIGRRLGFLAEPVRRALRAASVLDTRFTVDDWALVTGQTLPQLMSMVDEALTAGVLTEADTHLTSRHPLIRQALHDELPAPVRTVIHAHAEQTLAKAGRSWDRVARHLLAAPNAIDGWALHWLAGLPAETLYAQPTTSAQLLEIARQATVASDPHRALLTTRLTTVLRLLWRYDDLIRLGTEALGTVTDPQLVGQIGYNLSVAYNRSDRYAEAYTVITRVLDGPDPGVPLRSRLRADLAMTLCSLGRHAEGRAEAQQTILEGERDDDPVSVGFALNVLAWLAWMAADTDALALTDRALQIVGDDDPESTDLRLLLLINRVEFVYDLDQTTTVKTELPRVIAEAERNGSPRQMQIKNIAAIFFVDQGDWDQALVYLDQIAGAFDTVPPREVADSAGVAARIALCRGDPPTAARHLAVLDDTPFTSGVQRHHTDALATVAALLAEADGQVERAAALLAERLDPQHPWLHPYDFLPEVIRLALAVGDRGTVHMAVEIAEAGAGTTHQARLQASAQVCRAMVDDDPAAMLKAADYLERVGRRPFQAFVLQEAAVRLAQRGDTSAARAAFTTAVAIYDDLRSILDLRHIQSRLRPFGIRRGSRAAHRRVLVGWDALTPAERTIATLVSRGESNPGIAAQLFLSRRTVEVHVGHILRKLKVRSRVEIAHEVTRHQPTTPNHPHQPDEPGYTASFTDR